MCGCSLSRKIRRSRTSNALFSSIYSVSLIFPCNLSSSKAKSLLRYLCVAFHGVRLDVPALVTNREYIIPRWRRFVRSSASSSRDAYRADNPQLYLLRDSKGGAISAITISQEVISLVIFFD